MSVIIGLAKRISCAIPESMKYKLVTCIENHSDIDMFYLCKWNVECSSLTQINGDIGLYTSNYYKGVQAIMFLQKSKEMIMNENIYYNDDFLNPKRPFSDIVNNKNNEGIIKVGCFMPNIIEYDIRFAKKPNDYLKMNECSTIAYRSPNENITYVWFIFIILLVLAVAWAVIKLKPDDKVLL